MLQLDQPRARTGNIRKETSTNLGATRAFTMDAVGRLTKENTSVYAYDGADELTTNGATTQAYDAAGQLTTGVTGATSTAFTFDARGDRTKATTGTTTTTYAYDQGDRLTGYTRGTTTATYTYNGDGLRATKAVGTTTSRFVYDTGEGMPLILSDGAGYYLYGPGGTPYAQTSTGGVTTYLHADQSGTVRLITSTTGTAAGTATYTAYGTRTTTGTTSAFGYAGQYTDTETGMQWLRARYYDPTTAQFLTVDPLAALTWSRYGYASGNPITSGDPSGLASNGEQWPPKPTFPPTQSSWLLPTTTPVFVFPTAPPLLPISSLSGPECSGPTSSEGASSGGSIMDVIMASVGVGLAAVGVAAIFVTLPFWIVVAAAVLGVATAGYGVYRLFGGSPF